MADQTDLVIAVDTSQVHAAAEALKTLGFQAAAAERAADRLSSITVDSGQIRSAAEALRALGFQASVVEGHSDKLARSIGEAGREVVKTSQASAASMRDLSQSASKAITDVDRATANLGTKKVSLFDQASIDAAKAKTAVIDLSKATTSLGANPGTSALQSGLKGVDTAAASASDKLAHLREEAERVNRLAGSLASSTLVPKVSEPVNYMREPVRQERAPQIPALFKSADQWPGNSITASSEAIERIGVKAAEASKQVAGLRNQLDAVNAGGGNDRIPPPPPTRTGGSGSGSDGQHSPKSDLEEINSYMTASERAAQSAQRALRDTASAALTATSGVTDLSRATTSLGATGFVSVDKVGTSLGAAAAKASEASDEVRRLEANINRLNSAGTSFGAAEGPKVEPNDLRSRFAAADSQKAAQSQQLYDRLTRSATAATNGQTEALKKSSTAHDGHWKSVRRTAYEQQQLSYQLHDFTVQVLGGQSPFLALVQQGSQLAGVFGGVRGAIAAVVGLITPTVAVIGTMAIAAGGLAFAMAKVESSARTINSLQIQLEATGRAGEFTDQQLKGLINTLALTAGVSKTAATAIISEFSRAQEIPTKLLTKLAPLVADFARGTGQDIPQAAGQLARAFSEPAEGAKSLEKALGSLKSAEILAIQEFVRVGNTAAAQDVLFQALERSVKGLADRGLTPLQIATNELGNSWDRAMQSLERSEGLKKSLEYLAKIVDAMTWIINNADKIGMLGGVGPSQVPGVAGPMAIANAGSALVERGVAAIRGGLPVDTSKRSASGKIDGAPTGQTAPTQTVMGKPVKGPEAPASDRDGEIKKALELAGAYRSVAGQQSDLVKKRDALSKAAKLAAQEYGYESAQAVRLRDAIAGINEQIEKKGAKANRQENRIADIIFKDRLNEIRDTLTKQRDNLSAQDRLNQTAYQLGEISLKTALDRRVDVIKANTDAQIKAIDDQMAAVRERLKDPKLDPERRARFTEQLDDLGRERGIIENRGSNELAVANDQARISYQQLLEQVENYRIELLRLQGDEEKAAELQAKQAIRRAKILAGQAANDPRVGNVNVQALERGLAQQRALNQAKEITTFLNERLALQEGAIDRALQKGDIGSITAMTQQSAVRQLAVTELEKIVKGMEEVAALAQNQNNWRLQLDTAQAREQLEQLKAAIDPLADKFQSIFQGAAQDFLGNLMEIRRAPSNRPGDQLDAPIRELESNLSRARTDEDRARLRDEIGRVRARRDELNDQKRTDPIVELFKQLFNTIGKQINGLVSQELTAKLFGKDGMFGDLGKRVAEIFGGKKGSPEDPTSKLRSTLDTATPSLTRLTSAADAAANALARVGGGSIPTVPGGTGVQVPEIGDDGLGIPTITDATSKASDVITENAKVSTEATTNTVSALVSLANAAQNGGSALSALPSIITALQASGVGGSGGPGGFIGNILGSIFKSSGPSTFVNDMGGIELAGSLGFSKGGYTGDDDAKTAVGVVHGREFVFSAPATAAIGRERLEAAHALAKSGDSKALSNVLVQSLYGRGEAKASKTERKVLASAITKRVLDRHLPGYYQGGYVGSHSKTVGYRAMTANRDSGEGQRNMSNSTVVQVQVTPPPGASRETAMQWGNTAGRHIQNSIRRNG